MTEEEFLNILNITGYQMHQVKRRLIWEQKNYRIMPDEAFYFKDKIVLIEFESNKRLVESISKYWWLYKSTDWRSNNIKLELHFKILKSHNDEILEESVRILGDELSKQEPDFFFFYYQQNN